MVTEYSEEKASQQLHKNATSYIKQILKATLRKTAVLWPPTFHLQNYSNKLERTSGRLLQKLGQTHKWRCPMDPFT